MKQLRMFLQVFKLTLSIFKLFTDSKTVLALDDYDKVALAEGRWVMYKSMTNVAFQIGLDNDNEALLRQVTFYRINKGGLLDGEQTLAQVALMIELCQEAKLSNSNIKWVLNRKFL
jgi:hypothetical protein